PLFFLGVYCLFARQWRVLAGAGGTVLLISVASLLLCGPRLHRVWRNECLRPYAGKAMVAFNVQSASSFLARLTTDRDPDTSPAGHFDSWKPFELGWKCRAAQFAFLSLLGGATVLACRRPTGGRTVEARRLEWSLFLCLAL